MSGTIVSGSTTIATTIVIGGVSYSGSARCAAGFNAIDELTLNLDEGYDSVSFTLEGIGPAPPFAVGVSCVVKINGTAYLTGAIRSYTQHQVESGWAFTFSATCWRQDADNLPIVATDGSGEALFNRPPSDGPWYVASLAGQSVGSILTIILQVVANATALNALGIGQYTSLGPPTLPAATLADFANLTMVPPSTVRLGGQSMWSTLREFVRQWEPQFCLWIQKDGTIRATNLFTMGSNALVIAGETAGTVDPSTWPEMTVDVSNCYTAVEFVGTQVRWAYLSTANGTLTALVETGSAPHAAWTLADQNAWTVSVFTKTGDGQDSGTLSSVTSTSAVVTSNYAATHWTTNFWNAANRQGWIALQFFAGTGIAIQDTRQITSCTALTGGGSATVTWDAADPINTLSYTTYQIMGTAGSVVDVGRLFYVCEPSTGHTGLNTYIGSHLEPAFPTPVAIGIHSLAFLTSTALAWVVGQVGTGGIGFTFPIGIEMVPQSGAIRLVQPAVQLTAQPNVLQKMYPTTLAQGLPSDVQVIVPYNQGGLTARWPASGFAGTAYSTYGITRVLQVYLDSYTYPGQTSQLTLLAKKVLPTVQDAVIEGAISYHGFPGNFDPLSLGYSLSMTITGATGGSAPAWSGIALPARQVTLRWPQATGERWRVTWRLSNRRRPYEAYDAYVHPAPTGGAQGGQMPFENATVGRQFTPQWPSAGAHGDGSGMGGFGAGPTGPRVSGVPSQRASEAAGFRGASPATGKPKNRPRPGAVATDGLGPAHPDGSQAFRSVASDPSKGSSLEDFGNVVPGLQSASTASPAMSDKQKGSAWRAASRGRVLPGPDDAGGSAGGSP